MIISPKELSVNLAELYATGISAGYKTGWRTIDQYFTVKPSEFTVLTGMPSHGKSEWLDNLLVNLAMNFNFRVAIFSPENHPLELHAAKIMEKYQQKHFFKTDGFFARERMSADDMLDCIDAMSKNFAFVKPDENAFTPLDIINEALPWLHQFVNQPKAMIIDPWNEMDHYRPSGLTETEYISRTLTELRRAAREYNVHLFLVCHPMKMQKDKDGNYPVPKPYDISGSAHWYNKADNCIAIWRDVLNQPLLTEVHIQKVRFKGTGKVGMIPLRYDLNRNSYFDIEN
jgi:twinkle protein